jgi:hypothetical protein
MSSQTQLFTPTSPGYGGFFFNPDDRSAVEVDPVNGWILIHNRTVVLGSSNVKGGIWIGAVNSDPDIAAIGIDVSLTFRQAHGDIFGLGYATSQLEFGVTVIDVETGDSLADQRSPIVQDAGFLLPIWGDLGAGPVILPSSFNNRFVVPKPATSSRRQFLVGFFLDSWTGGGPTIEAHLNAEVTLNSATIFF